MSTNSDRPRGYGGFVPKDSVVAPNETAQILSEGLRTALQAIPRGMSESAREALTGFMIPPSFFANLPRLEPVPMLEELSIRREPAVKKLPSPTSTLVTELRGLRTDMGTVATTVERLVEVSEQEARARRTTDRRIVGLTLAIVVLTGVLVALAVLR
jgi:hypothetical protein